MNLKDIFMTTTTVNICWDKEFKESQGANFYSLHCSVNKLFNVKLYIFDENDVLFCLGITTFEAGSLFVFRGVCQRSSQADQV